MIRYIHDLNAGLIGQSYTRFRSLNLWGGPSLDFHRMTISCLRQQQQLANFSYVSLLQNEDFLVLLYGTLATWGLHRMGARRRMIRFDVFKEQVRLMVGLLDDVARTTLSDCALEQISSRREKILSLFKGPRITEIPGRTQQNNNRVPILVANSKLLHHLHPNLFPPVDREYIVRYFYCRSINVRQVPIPNTIDNQAKIFWEILTEYKRFYCLHRKIVNRYLNQDITGMETSITKIIDNIVVGYVSLLTTP